MALTDTFVKKIRHSGNPSGDKPREFERALLADGLPFRSEAQDVGARRLSDRVTRESPPAARGWPTTFKA
jgi:hypothetical protein